LLAGSVAVVKAAEHAGYIPLLPLIH